MTKNQLEMTNYYKNENRKAACNSRFAKAGVLCFYETFVQASTAVILLNFFTKNPPHRQS